MLTIFIYQIKQFKS